MKTKDPWSCWKACTQVVVLFFLLMLIRTILYPETRTERLPKQSYSEQEKSSHSSGDSRGRTIMRSLFDTIKGES